MARDPYIEQRLINWGRWKAGAGSGGLGYATTAWDAFDVGDRYGSTRAAVMPEGEESITDQAVRSLSDEMQTALEQQFVHGGSVETKAKRLACHVMTFRNRVNTAMRGVSAWLAERERANAAERSRVEGLQQSMSAGLADRERQALAERSRTDKILGIKPVRRIRAPSK